MENAPVVYLNQPDYRLNQPSSLKRYYPHEPLFWEGCVVDGLYRWPEANLVTLKPTYEDAPTEAELVYWTTDDRGSYQQVLGAWWADTMPAILQEDPKATNLWLLANNLTADNQPFYVDFFPLEAYDKDWYADLYFSTRYCLRFTVEGHLQLWRNWDEFSEDGDWRPAASGKTVKSLFGEHLTVVVYPSNEQLLIIHPLGYDPIFYRDLEPIVTIEDDGNRVNTICPSTAVEFWVSGGSFYFTYRKMTFATAGSIIFPQQSLPWTYYEAYTIESEIGRPRTEDPSTVSTVILNAAGEEIDNPEGVLGDHWQDFWPQITVASGDGDRTPELYWTQFHIGPTNYYHEPTPITISGEGRLQEAQVRAAIDGEREARIVVHNMDGGLEAWGITSNLRMCSQIDVGATTVWKGYLTNQEEQFPQRGDIQVALLGSDPLSRLEIPLSDSFIGDGQYDTDFIEQLFLEAGLDATDFTITGAPMKLPQSLGVEPPLFQGMNGRLMREFIDYICKVWTGRALYASSTGHIYYTDTPAGAAQGHVVFSEPTDPGTQLKAYQAGYSRSIEEFFNFIVVIGENWRQEALLAYYYNTPSVNDPASAYYIGYERPCILVDTNLKTLSQMEIALGWLRDYYGTPQEEIDANTAFTTLVDVYDHFTSPNAQDWQVRAIEWNFAQRDTDLRMRLRREM